MDDVVSLWVLKVEEDCWLCEDDNDTHGQLRENTASFYLQINGRTWVVC